MDQPRPPCRIVFHPAPAPGPDGVVRIPDPLVLPADPATALAWIARRLGLRRPGRGTPPRFTMEPLVLPEPVRPAAPRVETLEVELPPDDLDLGLELGLELPVENVPVETDPSQRPGGPDEGDADVELALDLD